MSTSKGGTALSKIFASSQVLTKFIFINNNNQCLFDLMSFAILSLHIYIYIYLFMFFVISAFFCSQQKQIFFSRYLISFNWIISCKTSKLMLKLWSAVVFYYSFCKVSLIFPVSCFTTTLLLIKRYSKDRFYKYIYFLSLWRESIRSFQQVCVIPFKVKIELL